MYYVYFETEARLLHEEAKYNVEVATRQIQEEVAEDLRTYGEVKNVQLLSEPYEKYPVLTRETYKRNI